MATVVGEEREVVPQCGGSDQEVEIADDRARGTKSSALPSEDLRGLDVEAEDRDAAEEILEVLRVARASPSSLSSSRRWEIAGWSLR